MRSVEHPSLIPVSRSPLASAPGQVYSGSGTGIWRERKQESCVVCVARAYRRTCSVCNRSNATGPADPTCRLMSGWPRKRSTCPAATKCGDGPCAGGDKKEGTRPFRARLRSNVSGRRLEEIFPSRHVRFAPGAEGLRSSRKPPLRAKERARLRGTRCAREFAATTEGPVEIG